jgi:hypothetical protein
VRAVEADARSDRLALFCAAAVDIFASAVCARAVSAEIDDELIAFADALACSAAVALAISPARAGPDATVLLLVPTPLTTDPSANTTPNLAKKGGVACWADAEVAKMAIKPKTRHDVRFKATSRE